MENSLKTQQTDSFGHTQQLFDYEPLNPDERQRMDCDPVGLKNIGNTCYFNSLIQAYFFMPNFLMKILQAS